MRAVFFARRGGVAKGVKLFSYKNTAIREEGGVACVYAFIVSS